ncbi:Endopolyphosphatase [Dissophora globulifera]|nr:Endopolyphosphatase [Dissophora globulifera]
MEQDSSSFAAHHSRRASIPICRHYAAPITTRHTSRLTPCVDTNEHVQIPFYGFSSASATTTTTTTTTTTMKTRPSRSTRWLKHGSARLLVACCVLSCLLIPSFSSSTGGIVSAQPDPYDPEKSRLRGHFLHITDIHPDEHYITGGSISSSCHRNTTDDDDEENRLRMMRPGRRDGGYGGIYGASYSICDSPFTLANATFDWIDKNLIGTIDFVIWTGDNARHDSDNEYPRTQKEIEDLNREIANRFLETFTPDKDDPYQQRIPIVPSIGNNDVYPHNIMQAGPNRILQHFSEIWAEFIPESQFHTFQHGGYFHVEVVPGKISILSLNTLYFFNQNAAVDGCVDEDEPGTDQMDWLMVELESLRRRGMTAYLTGHVPPARKSYSPSCYVRYTDIALRYQDVIVGHLYGHANIDHFFILSQATLLEDEGRRGHDRVAEFDSDSDEITIGQGNGQIALTSGKKARSWDDESDHEYDPFTKLGLSSYLIELWEQYADIPKRAKMTDYAIVNVSPSVVPTYNPTLRVYTYQLAIEKSAAKSSLSLPPPLPLDIEAEGYDDEEDEEDESFVDEYEVDEQGKNKKKKKKDKKKKPKKPKKPKRPANPPAAPPITFGFPLNYTQYWVNLTQANAEAKKPEYTVEYRSREDWGLQNLSVPEWLGLAKKIVHSEKVKAKYTALMVVLTGTENDHY